MDVVKPEDVDVVGPDAGAAPGFRPPPVGDTGGSVKENAKGALVGASVVFDVGMGVADGLALPVGVKVGPGAAKAGAPVGAAPLRATVTASTTPPADATNTVVPSGDSAMSASTPRLS
jgi:hypothetical protein